MPFYYFHLLPNFCFSSLFAMNPCQGRFSVNLCVSPLAAAPTKPDATSGLTSVSLCLCVSSDDMLLLSLLVFPPASAAALSSSCPDCRNDTACCESAATKGLLENDRHHVSQYRCSDLIRDNGVETVETGGRLVLRCDPGTRCVDTCDWELPSGDHCTYVDREEPGLTITTPRSTKAIYFVIYKALKCRKRIIFSPPKIGKFTN